MRRTTRAVIALTNPSKVERRDWQDTQVVIAYEEYRRKELEEKLKGRRVLEVTSNG